MKRTQAKKNRLQQTRIQTKQIIKNIDSKVSFLAE
jgi:hypothetical protein